MKEKMILKRKLFLVFLVALSLMLTAGATVVSADLAVDFGASGLYNYDASSTWTKLSTANVQWLGAYGGKLVGDFGAYGLYEYNGAAWTRIAFANADNSGNTMVAFNGGLAVDIGAGGGGVWYYKDGSWSKISTNDVQWLGTYNDKLVGDFGAYGLYEYDGAAWTRIAFANADNSGNTMVAYDGGLAVDVGTSGLWYYKNGNWTQISTANPQWLKSYNDYFFDPDTVESEVIPRIAVDFGVYGLWRYGGTGWTKLSTGDADNSGNTMVVYELYENPSTWLWITHGGLAVDFGVSGLWTYDQYQDWKKLSSVNPQWLATDSDDFPSNELLIDFGASGLYRYDNMPYTSIRWKKLSTADADNSGNTMTDW